ncbi:hypothetical protein OLMES_3599 [Oleiphilus messinensis]|uniref:Uncharacterized protein n=1 Tax=Oleiphilus messinensis TaxID=141451 RepID=A0A1Y0ICX3_9GAMM|nr:chemotaxis protein CheX [Oleiphilus messinensis]ARU57626.1 hypothetical protein OLMES_3599 [Oleiphilus messinensis]
MQTTKIVSKVLVHEFDATALETIKTVCNQNNLVGLKDTSQNINDILKSNVDLGAIFLYEGLDAKGSSGQELAKLIHRVRPELPIFLRRDSSENLDDLPTDYQKAIAGAYQLGNPGKLQGLVDEYICSMYYPIELAQGIQEISTEAFQNMIQNIEVDCDLPYLVKDQIIFGELFSLIPLESNWCRGYMMLQVTEQEIVETIRAAHTGIISQEPDFSDANAVLNELTNMIWGGIKSRYFSTQESVDESHRTQVPIIVDHLNKFISFGSTEPQLCFKYTLKDKVKEAPDITIYQRLIFNLSWSPDKFSESDAAVDNFVESGELEFF